MKHLCHAVSCKRSIPPKLLFCLPHWQMVPRELQRLIWAFYKAGQEVRKDPTPGYLIVQAITVGYVAVNTGQMTKDQNEKNIIETMITWGPRMTPDELATFKRLEPRMGTELEAMLERMRKPS